MSLETDVQHMLRTLTKKQMNAVAATWNEVMEKGNTGYISSIFWDSLMPSYDPTQLYYTYSGMCGYVDEDCTTGPPKSPCGLGCMKFVNIDDCVKDPYGPGYARVTDQISGPFASLEICEEEI